MVIYRGGNEFFKMYLVYLYQSEDILGQIKKMQAGSGQPQLPIKVMKEILLPIPTIIEQQAIVTQLELLLINEQKAKSATESVLNQIDTMKKEILARAFRGELGTNDPADSWARELLERVL